MVTEVHVRPLPGEQVTQNWIRKQSRTGSSVNSAPAGGSNVFL